MTGSPAQISVLIVEDHALLSEALSCALSEEPGIRVVGTANSAEAGVAAARSLSPDVTLMDYRFPQGDGISAARAIIAADPGARVIVLTATSGDRVKAAAIQAGCVGYVNKSQGLERLGAAIRLVHSGATAFAQEDMAAALRGVSSEAIGEALSGRELQVLELLAEGGSNASIAAALSVSAFTVRNHIQSAMEKLGAHTRLEAIILGRRMGLLRDGD